MKTCGHCGSSMEPDQIFCDKCGYRYVEPQPPRPSPQPSPPPQPRSTPRPIKLSIIMIIAVVIVAGGIALIELQRSSDKTVALTKQKAMYMAREYARKYEGIINGYINVLDTLANLMASYENVEAGMRRQTYEDILHSAFVYQLDFVRLFTVWKPNALDGMDRLYIGRIGSTPTGQFAFAWTWESGEVAPMTSDIVGEAMAHLTGPNQRYLEITDPTVIKLLRKDTWCVRIMVPIVNQRNNEVVGAVGCLLNVSYIQPRVEQDIEENDDVTSMAIYTNTGFILANYLPQKIGKQLLNAETQYGVHLNEVALAVKNAQEWEGSNYAPELKTTMYMSIAPISLRASPTTWAIMVGLKRK